MKNLNIIYYYYDLCEQVMNHSSDYNKLTTGEKLEHFRNQ